MINKVNKILHAPFSKEEKFEDTKGIIRIRLVYGVYRHFQQYFNTTLCDKVCQ
jgi:hypothetical protein